MKTFLSAFLILCLAYNTWAADADDQEPCSAECLGIMGPVAMVFITGVKDNLCRTINSYVGFARMDKACQEYAKDLKKCFEYCEDDVTPVSYIPLMDFVCFQSNEEIKENAGALAAGCLKAEKDCKCSRSDSNPCQYWKCQYPCQRKIYIDDYHQDVADLFSSLMRSVVKSTQNATTTAKMTDDCIGLQKEHGAALKEFANAITSQAENESYSILTIILCILNALFY